MISKYPDLNDTEKILVEHIVGLVKQNFQNEDRGYFSGFIYVHAETLRLLSELGLAEILDTGPRCVWAKLLPPANELWFG